MRRSSKRRAAAETGTGTGTAAAAEEQEEEEDVARRLAGATVGDDDA